MSRKLPRNKVKRAVLEYVIGKKVSPERLSAALLLDRGLVDSVLHELWKENKVSFISDGKKKNSLVMASFSELFLRTRSSGDRPRKK